MRNSQKLMTRADITSVVLRTRPIRRFEWELDANRVPSCRTTLDKIKTKNYCRARGHAKGDCPSARCKVPTRVKVFKSKTGLATFPYQRESRGTRKCIRLISFLQPTEQTRKPHSESDAFCIELLFKLDTKARMKKLFLNSKFHHSITLQSVTQRYASPIMKYERELLIIQRLHLLVRFRFPRTTS